MWTENFLFQKLTSLWLWSFLWSMTKTTQLIRICQALLECSLCVEGNPETKKLKNAALGRGGPDLSRDRGIEGAIANRDARIARRDKSLLNSRKLTAKREREFLASNKKLASTKGKYDHPAIRLFRGVPGRIGPLRANHPLSK